MKIEPYLGDDAESREEYANDGYDEQTIRFYEEHDEDGYSYELYVLIDGAPAQIVIGDTFVGIWYKYGETIHTGIKPVELFGEKEKLEWDDILKIIAIIERSNAAGQIVSATEIENLWEEFKERFPEVDDEEYPG